jgi:hypothetical protein
MRIGSTALAPSAVGFALLFGGTQAQSQPSDSSCGDIEIETLSTKLWLVSGGDVLVEIRVTGDVLIDEMHRRMWPRPVRRWSGLSG